MLTSASPDLDEMILIELEKQFDDKTCQGCDKKALWKLVASCGHTADVCNYHKLQEMRRFKMDFPLTYCHIRKDEKVTSLEAEPL